MMEIPECPECKSKWNIDKGNGIWYCPDCNIEFEEEE